MSSLQAIQGDVSSSSSTVIFFAKLSRVVFRQIPPESRLLNLLPPLEHMLTLCSPFRSYRAHQVPTVANTRLAHSPIGSSLCNQAGQWLWSADCGVNQKCVENPSGVAHCQLRPKALFEAREDIQPFSSSAEPRGCVPGTYRCSGENILTCDALGDWVQSAWCGHNWICKEGPAGVAHCVPRTPLVKAREEMPNTLSVVARQIDDPSDSPPIVVRQDPSLCTGDGFACSEHMIVQCQDGHWQGVRSCGNDWCAKDPQGTPICVPDAPHPPVHGRSTLRTVAKEAAATAKA
jgi:hypothetical protein